MSIEDKDREAAYTLDALIGTVFNSPSNPKIVGWCRQYLARAREEGVVEGRDHCQRFALAEAAGRERDACAEAVEALHTSWDDEPAAMEALEMAAFVIRSRGERSILVPRPPKTRKEAR